MGNRLNRIVQELSDFLAFEQPRLTVQLDNADVVIVGEFDLKPRNEKLSSHGKLDGFSIRLELPLGFPRGEPRLFETAGRIPHEADRHVNSDGSCCYGVWEAWCAQNPPVSFESFLNGPVQNFFFGQHYFEQHRKWPYGEYRHGKQGLLESYAEVLSCEAKIETIRYRLQLFCQPWPKGHWLCVCGSKKKLRDCCAEIQQSPPISPKSAKHMKKRFDLYFEK